MVGRVVNAPAPTRPFFRSRRLRAGSAVRSGDPSAYPVGSRDHPDVSSTDPSAASRSAPPTPGGGHAEADLPESPVRRVMSSTRELARRFRRDGFAVARGVFDSDHVARLERAFDDIVAQSQRSGEDIDACWGGPRMDALGAEGTSVLHTHDVQQFSAEWLRGWNHDATRSSANRT